MNYRPRINKKHSVKVRKQNYFTIIKLILVVTVLMLQDTEQKKSGNFFFLET